MAIINERKKVNDFQFNNDASCFAVATNNGFKIFSTNPLKELVSRDNIGELSKVEILEKTNIIAYVGTQNNSKFSNNKLVLWDDDLQHPVGDIQFPSEILGFKIYRDRIVVALLTTTYLYDLQNLQLLQSIETHANPHGNTVIRVCEFNRNGTKALVTLGARQGSLRISYPDLKNSPIKEIFAHNGPIRCVSLDKTGKYLASASEKGTIIRVFDLTRNELSAVRIFRRGSESAIISSIIFDPTSKFLCVSSSTETIHIFSMENTSFYSYLKSYYTSEIRSSIKLKLPLESEGLKSICCFNSQLNTVHVVNQDGRFFKYAIDLQVESEKNFESYLHFI